MSPLISLTFSTNAYLDYGNISLSLFIQSPPLKAHIKRTVFVCSELDCPIWSGTHEPFSATVDLYVNIFFFSFFIHNNLVRWPVNLLFSMFFVTIHYSLLLDIRNEELTYLSIVIFHQLIFSLLSYLYEYTYYLLSITIFIHLCRFHSMIMYATVMNTYYYFLFMYRYTDSLPIQSFSRRTN